MSPMTWADVMANPYLQDLPFKIELNKWGRIEMSPASNEHGEMYTKAALYIEAGAEEVWLQALDGERRVVRN